MEGKMETGFVYKIVTCLLVGCLHFKKYKKIKFLNRIILIIDFGLHLCLVELSLSLSFKTV